MIPIPAGDVPSWAARRPSRAAVEDEGPQVQVKVHAFWMAKIETTWDLYDLYYKNEQIPEGDKRRDEPVVTADAMTRPTPHFTDDTWGHGREGKPTLGMTHHAAMMYCHWLSQKDRQDLPPADRSRVGIRLPGRAHDRLPVGRRPGQGSGEYAWFAGNAEDDTARRRQEEAECLRPVRHVRQRRRVVLRPLFAGGLRAVPGRQACAQSVRKPTDVKYSHVVRGGSWADEPPKCRSAARRGSDKTWLKRDPQKPQSIWWMTDCDWVGFRVVRPVEEIAELKGFLPPVTWTE